MTFFSVLISANFRILALFHVYVSNTTKLLPSKRNKDVNYFNMTLHSPTKVFRGVCYRPELMSHFSDAEQKKSPLKLSNVKRKINDYFPDLEDMEITKYSKIEPSNEEFNYKILNENIKTVSIKDISLDDVGIFINTVGYIRVEGQPVSFITTRFSDGPTAMKMAILNDDTASINIEIWGDFVQQVIKNGCYEVQKAKVKEWPAGVIKLTTSTHSNIIPSDKDFTPNVDEKSMEPELFEAEFPAMTVDKISTAYVCSKCKKTTAKEFTKFFKCEHCGLQCLKCKIKSLVTAKVLMEIEGKPQVVNMNAHVIKSFYNKMSMPVPDNENHIVEDLLTKTNIKVSVDKKYNCLDLH